MNSPGYRGFSFGKGKLDSDFGEGGQSMFVIEYPGQQGSPMKPQPVSATKSVSKSRSRGQPLDPSML